MSVQPGPTFKPYAANGVAKVYAIPFLLLDAADLQITLNGVLVTTGFVLSGIGNATSACTFSVAPTGDLLFQQAMTFQRLSDYQMNGDFLTDTVNRDYDRLWLAVKQVSRDSGRALTVNALEPEGIPALPAKLARALRVLAFDALGQPITSTLTLEQLEQQPNLAAEAVAQAQAAAVAAGSSAGNAGVSAGLAAGSAAAAAGSAAAALASELAAATYASDPWALQPIGVPIPLLTHLAGVTEPPTNKAYRYIKLTASDAYNAGVLTGESVSGTAPNVLASANINLAGSPLNGQSVHLINTMRRILKSGASGVLEADQLGPMKYVNGTYATATTVFVYNGNPSTTAALPRGGGTGVGTPVDAAPDGTVWITNTGTETRVKSLGATYYMRVK